MIRKKITLLLILFIVACSDRSNDEQVETIDLISIKIDGSTFSSGIENISLNPVIKLTFSGQINKQSFEETLFIDPNNSVLSKSFSYLNNSSVVDITLDLNYDTTYNLVLQGTIGSSGQRLSEVIDIIFKTQVDETIYSRPPCQNVNDCLQSVNISNSSGNGNFYFYSNYDIYEDKAQWQDLEKAIFVVHGGSVNPGDYFSYLTSTLNNLEISEKTILISPNFKETEESPGDLYWQSVGYRDGDDSDGAVQISSFEVIDQIINKLADKTHFPVLDEIIVTGQSSGGRFTHSYAAANRVESSHSDINFEYIVSQNQFFYYPTNERIDVTTNNLYIPTGCNGINYWPYGYLTAPPYVSVLEKSEFNTRFINRNIIYLLGSGTGNDSSLNSSCQATLSGPNRYQRGENMFRYMNLKYGNDHNHKKVVIPGITHDGYASYTSNEFKSLITQLFND